MKKDNYITLIYKSLKGEISAAEAKDLRAWESAAPENRAEAEEVRRAWKASADYDLPFDLDMNADFAKIQSRLQPVAQTETAAPTGKVVTMPPRRNNWLRIAAAVLLLVVAGFVIRNSFNGAAIDRITVTASADVQEITLPDGTVVNLNANSTLTYPQQFAQEERPVELSGEAFFVVTKDAAKPFRVLTEHTTVTVLGTEFNVNARANAETVKVAVREGKVRVSENVGDDKVTLTADEKAIYNVTTGEMREVTDKNLNDLAWQRKSLRFSDTQLQNTLSEIADFYNVKVELANPTIAGCAFSGRFKTQTSAADVLQNVAKVFNATVVEKEEGSYIIAGGNCK